MLCFWLSHVPKARWSCEHWCYKINNEAKHAQCKGITNLNITTFVHRLKLFIRNLSIRGKYRVVLFDLFASDGFSATVCMFIRFSQGTRAVGLINGGKRFQPQILAYPWLSFHPPGIHWIQVKFLFKKQHSLKKIIIIKNLSPPTNKTIGLLLHFSICCLKDCPWVCFAEGAGWLLDVCNLQHTGAMEPHPCSSILQGSQECRGGQSDLQWGFIWSFSWDSSCCFPPFFSRFSSRVKLWRWIPTLLLPFCAGKANQVAREVQQGSALL